MTVFGRVQGVGFRWFVQQEAQRCGARGWVRNLPGGEVELHAEGSAQALAELERAVEAGPRYSRVDHVDRREVSPAGVRSFEIRF